MMFQIWEDQDRHSRTRRRREIKKREAWERMDNGEHMMVMDVRRRGIPVIV